MASGIIPSPPKNPSLYQLILAKLLSIVKRIYLDHNASTPLLPESLEAMRPWLGADDFGNPSSQHTCGRWARAAVDDARSEMASLLGAGDMEIIFTGGGTESIFLGMAGLAIAAHGSGKRHLITQATEHPAALQTGAWIEKVLGWRVTRLPVDACGKVVREDFVRAFCGDTGLVSIMSANNETGVRQETAFFGAFCREKGVPFHCDAAQSFGKEPVAPSDWGADAVSLAAHKAYGPKGVGALYLRNGIPFESPLVGGGQEGGRRGGTENVAGIVGMAVAARFVSEKSAGDSSRLRGCVEWLWGGLKETGFFYRNGLGEDALPNTLNVSVEGVDGESLLMMCDLAGVELSAGSACRMGSVQPSHVLVAMGRSVGLARASLRFSLGRETTSEDIAEACRRVLEVVGRLREKHQNW